MGEEGQEVLVPEHSAGAGEEEAGGGAGQGGGGEGAAAPQGGRCHEAGESLATETSFSNLLCAVGQHPF